MDRFQRLGASSNTQVGTDFETVAGRCLADRGIRVQPDFSVPVGVGDVKRPRAFDFGSEDPAVLVECKSHRWTAGGNVPSAKLTVWNEAMYYFHIAPQGFRGIFFILRDYSEARGLTLGEYYLQRFPHLVPAGVEFWEYNEDEGSCRVLTD